MKKMLWVFFLIMCIDNRMQAMSQPKPHHNPRTDVTDIFPELQTKNAGLEIELKIKLDDKQKTKFLSWLDTNAQKEKQVTQIDDYYDKEDDSFFFETPDQQGLRYLDALRFVRIRHAGPKIMLTTKLRHINENGDIESCEEFEKKITSEQLNDFQQSLDQHGYIKKITVQKERTVYNARLEEVDYEIAIDQVTGLDGIFIEIELKKADTEAKDGTQLLHNLLKEIGITEIVLYKRGYVVILSNPSIHFEKKVILQ